MAGRQWEIAEEQRKVNSMKRKYVLKKNREKEQKNWPDARAAHRGDVSCDKGVIKCAGRGVSGAPSLANEEFSPSPPPLPPLSRPRDCQIVRMSGGVVAWRGVAWRGVACWRFDGLDASGLMACDPGVSRGAAP